MDFIRYMSRSILLCESCHGGASPSTSLTIHPLAESRPVLSATRQVRSTTGQRAGEHTLVTCSKLGKVGHHLGSTRNCKAPPRKSQPTTARKSQWDGATETTTSSPPYCNMH